MSLDARLLTPYLTVGKETLIYIRSIYSFFLPYGKQRILRFFFPLMERENNGFFPIFPDGK